MTELGSLLPSIEVEPPGPASRALAARLRAAESRNVTWLAGDFPVFWTEARGANVRDADGNVYVDLTAAFGVALAGHAHPRVVAAVQAQVQRLPHGMGDVHPPALKVDLLERLAALAPWPEARCVLASTGSEAVEIALKTALLATGRPGILAFQGGYHGLTLGALAATSRAFFRDRFRRRLYEGVEWAPVPREGGPDPAAALAEVERLLSDGGEGGEPIGAVLVEPVQGRAGVRPFPPGFLASVAELARAHGALVVADEILTGMGRCGAPLASTRLGVVPDIVCLGKALGGGLPVSACLAPVGVMDAWPESRGEAIHTSTFLGHPLGCAAALAMLDLLEEGLAWEAEQVGTRLLGLLTREMGDVAEVAEIRGVGAMIGIDLRRAGGAEPLAGAGALVAVAALRRGVLVLPAGEHGHVVALTPPAVLTDDQARRAVRELGAAVREVVS
ncbi:MAG TPA: aspartate aminotransferase family protein [Longimicrobiales bacterium]|jgi:4-aminobutyrate aminotransferase/(S)-3-amino-2-methylpropionate transaminase